MKVTGCKKNIYLTTRRDSFWYVAPGAWDALGDKIFGSAPGRCLASPDVSYFFADVDHEEEREYDVLGH